MLIRCLPGERHIVVQYYPWFILRKGHNWTTTYNFFCYNNNNNNNINTINYHYHNSNYYIIIIVIIIRGVAVWLFPFKSFANFLT